MIAGERKPDKNAPVTLAFGQRYQNPTPQTALLVKQ